MADAIVTSKICTGCKLEKKFSEFDVHKLGRFGLHPRCKPCRSATYSARRAVVSARNFARRDERIAYNKAWRTTNRERAESYSAVYRDQNRQYYSDWQKNNPDKVRAKNNARRARRLAALGSYTAAEADKLLESQWYRCACCEGDLLTVKRHLDHWMPLALGGSNYIENLQWLCGTCNRKKSKKDPINWLSQIGKASHWPKAT